MSSERCNVQWNKWEPNVSYYRNNSGGSENGCASKGSSLNFTSKMWCFARFGTICTI